ncbi:MAG: dihydroneopterin aldolase [Alphaproteobacteria bacterium]
MKKNGPARPRRLDEGSLWDGARDYTRVVLSGVEVEAHVGLHPWERHRERPTRLIVNVELFAHLPSAGRGASAAEPALDYDAIRAELRRWPRRRHVALLETLAEQLARVAFRNPRVEACRVSLVKPDIFNEAAGAGVEIYRLRPLRRAPKGGRL